MCLLHPLLQCQYNDLLLYILMSLNEGTTLQKVVVALIEKSFIHFWFCDTIQVLTRDEVNSHHCPYEKQRFAFISSWDHSSTVVSNLGLSYYYQLIYFSICQNAITACASPTLLEEFFHSFLPMLYSNGYKKSNEVGRI